MEGFKRCDKGHFYKEALPDCPYCPGGDQQKASGGISDKTQIVGGGADLGSPTVSDITQIFGGGNAPQGNDKTQIFGGSGSTSSRDLSKTYISGMDEAEGDDAKPRLARKITGWLVSFTMDSMGVDFRVYEGKNRIGKDPSLEITISMDTTVSANHANLLFIQGIWYLEDEMSSNGTFVNGERLRPRNPIELKDNDKIKVGDTEFLFKTCI